MRIITLILLLFVIVILILHFTGTQLELGKKEVIEEETTVIETITEEGEVLETEVIVENKTIEDE